MTKQLTVINGGRNKLTSHIYEVHSSEGNIVDVLRFASVEDAAEFQRGIKGGYTVKPHTLPLEQLIDEVLDLWMDEILDEEEPFRKGLRMSEEVIALVEKVKGLPEFTAKARSIDEPIFGIDVVTKNSIPADKTSITFTQHEISLYERYPGGKVSGKFLYGEEVGFSYRNKDIDESEVLRKMKMSMRKCAGIPVDGVYLNK